jgi:hypothetical protein
MPQKIPGALPVSNEAMTLFSSVPGEEVSTRLFGIPYGRLDWAASYSARGSISRKSQIRDGHHSGTGSLAYTTEAYAATRRYLRPSLSRSRRARAVQPKAEKGHLIEYGG